MSKSSAKASPPARKGNGADARKSPATSALKAAPRGANHQKMGRRKG